MTNSEKLLIFIPVILGADILIASFQEKPLKERVSIRYLPVYPVILWNVKDVEVKGYTIHELVEEYLRKHSPVSLNPKETYYEYLGAESFSTVPGTNYNFQ